MTISNNRKAILCKNLSIFVNFFEAFLGDFNMFNGFQNKDSRVPFLNK